MDTDEQTASRRRPTLGETVSFYHMDRWFRDALVIKEANYLGHITFKTADEEYLQVYWPES